MATRMQQRRGTAAQWTSANPVLNAGEMGWESDTNKFKIGDGTNHWADIDYFADINSTVDPSFGTSITFEGATADSYETTLVVTDPTADRTITLPNATGTVVLKDSTDTFTNKSISLGTNTVTSTLAQLNTAVSDADVASLAGTETLTNKTISLASNTVTGTKAQFNTAMSDADFATLAGTETFTNKTLTSPVIAGASVTGHIIPATNDTYDLGSASYMFRDIYVGPGSLYVNGQKVLQTVSGDVIVTADINENLALRTSGSGNLELDPTGSGVVSIKGPLSMEAGSNISSADGNAVTFGGAINTDTISSKTTNTDLSITANGTGKVYLNDNAEVSGNLVIGGNLTVSGTSTTVNTETISLADNIIDLNSNFTSGTPTENSGLRIMRGDSANVQIRWNESSDVWDFTNDGTNYSALLSASSTDTLTNKSISLATNTITSTLAQLNTAVSDADLASLAGSETLTNKTLSSAVATTALTLNATAELRLADTDSSHYVGFKSPGTVTTNKIWTLPSADGTANQVLSTNGSATLSWSTPSQGAAFSEFMLIGA